MTDSGPLQDMKVAIALMSIFLNHAATGTLSGAEGALVADELNRTREGFLELITANQGLIKFLLGEVGALTGETPGEVLQRLGANAAAAAELEAED